MSVWKELRAMEVGEFKTFSTKDITAHQVRVYVTQLKLRYDTAYSVRNRIEDKDNVLVWRLR